MSVRLSVMMFLQYAIIGAWVPVLGPYLKTLPLTNTQTAWIWSTAALGSMFAPLIWGQIADRWLAAEKCISVCAAVAGFMLWGASQTTEPFALFGLFLIFWLFQGPILSVGSALTFRHLENPQRQFGPIRLWGTVGWMAASWVFGFWLMRYQSPQNHYGDSLRAGAIAAWLLAIYAFTLPPTPPVTPRVSPAHFGPWRRRLDAPLRAIQLLRVPAFAVYCVCLFVLYVSWPFNIQMTALLVASLNDNPGRLPAIMTIAQSTEVATLATLPFILGRFGQKRTMVLGIASWCLALVALSSGGPFFVVVPSLMLHGVFICCFLVAGQVFVNRIAHHEFRASAQGLLVLFNGLGQFVGNFLVSAIRDRTGDVYARVFLPAAIGIGLLTLFFVRTFQLPPPESHEQS